MKIKVLALAFSLVLTLGITTSSIAQVMNKTISTTVVDDDKDKNKKKTKSCKDTAVKSDCKAKKSCCDHKLKDDSCKDKKDKKSEGDKK